MDNFINDEDSETSEDEDDEEYQVKKPAKVIKARVDSKTKSEIKTKNESKLRVEEDLGGVRRPGRSKDNEKKVNALKDLKTAREGLQKKKGFDF